MGGMGSGGAPAARYLYQLLFGRAELSLLAATVLLAVGAMLTRRARGRTRPAGAPPTAARGLAEPPARTVLRSGLGALWILDGLLQAQPRMPLGLAPMVLEPAFAGQPAWLQSIGRFGVDLWTRNVVATDAFSVFLQVAIGLGLLLGTCRPLERLALSASIAWGLVVWVFGEGMGGLMAQGASWLSGAPGAALLYALLAALLLVLPADAFEAPRGPRAARAGVGAFLLAGAALQALPEEGFWRGGALSQLFASAAANPQPAALAAPAAALSRLSAAHPAAVNATVVALGAAVGIGLLSGRATRAFTAAAAALLVAGWWLGMDFGVLGGTGTDPNSFGPVAVVLASAEAGAWRVRRAARAARRHDVAAAPSNPASPAARAGSSAEGLDAAGRPREPAPVRLRVLLGRWLALAALLAACSTAVPVLEAVPAAAATPPGATPALLDGGGLASVPGDPPAPGFRLLDQSGREVSLARWRGQVVFLAFLDPVCYSTCPVEAAELAEAARLLAGRARRLEIVAIDANPVVRSPAMLRAFDAEHHVARLRDWEFLTGPLPALERVWAAYGAASETPRVGMVAHSLLVYVIDPEGREVALTQATGEPGTAIESAYAELFADVAASFLPRD
jgi:cytochrome oxidase Cu insertion factor (SCO1/SenC/PrrC family)